jgi:hypothetical protein
MTKKDTSKNNNNEIMEKQWSSPWIIASIVMVIMTGHHSPVYIMIWLWAIIMITNSGETNEPDFKKTKNQKPKQ